MATLLLERGAVVDQSDAWRSTPLFVASERGHANAVRLCVDRGAAVQATRVADEVRYLYGGATPLYAACQEGHAVCATLLLDHGADVGRGDDDGRTPLYRAVWR